MAFKVNPATGVSLTPYADRAIIFGQGNGRHEGNLVLRTTSDLAARALAAEVRVIDLNFAFEEIAIFPIGHGLHQLVLHQPRRRVTHSQLAPERQCRQSRLGLADQVDRQKPGCQRQFGSLEKRTGNQRCLVPTRNALKDLAYPVADNVVHRTGAARTTKTLRPAHHFQRLFALRLGSVVLEKLRHRQPRLKLDSVHRHDCHLRLFDGYHSITWQAHHMSQADECC